MDDDPGQGVRRKKDSSLVRAAEAVRDGKASAPWSAPATPAPPWPAPCCAWAGIKGVARPAIATPIPVPGVDADGAARRRRQRRVPAPSGSCSSPRWARPSPPSATASPSPGSACCRSARRTTKGTPLVKETHALLRRGARASTFIGNVEGRDIMTDDVDVVVTDGFTGNVALKTLEGGHASSSSARCSRPSTATEEAKEAAEVLLPALAPLADELDPDNHGGAMLLGVDGVCIISHGSSSARAIVNAVRVAREMVERRPGRPAAAAVASRTGLTIHKRTSGSVSLAVTTAARYRSVRARRDPRRTRSAGPPAGLRAGPRPPGRHPRDRARPPSPRAPRSPTTSTPTRWR